jgi:hypothetical protein
MGEAFTAEAGGMTTTEVSSAASHMQDHAEQQRLIERWIEANPHRPGNANARLREYGVPVWALIGHAQAVNGDAATGAADYDLPREAADAAFAFYRRHTAIIDDRLAANLA